MARNFLGDIPGNFFAVRTGTLSAVASDAAAARLVDAVFVAPANIKVVSAWRVIDANEATAATDSYRTLIMFNGGTSGTGTVGLGTSNSTVSKAAYASVGFTLAANPTVTQGGVIWFSHSTVGTDNNDGTAMAASHIQIAYELL